MLALSVWPRFGGDAANRSVTPTTGPHAAPVFRRIPLPEPAQARSQRDYMSGVIALPDGSLRVCHAGILSAMTGDGRLQWHVDLTSYQHDDDGQNWLWPSLPTALHTGDTLVILPHALLRVAATGHDVRVFTNSGRLDDTGMSPNVTRTGWPLIPSPLGDIYTLRNGRWMEIGGGYGYDLVPPAVYDDDALAVAGYYGKHFCRVDPDGTIRWQTTLRAADLLPTVNPHQIAGVGSVNDHLSAFFDANGLQIGEYPHASVFAVYGEDGWIALSRTRIARLTLHGQEIWSQNVSMHRMCARTVQPIVDADGYIYVRHDDGVRCNDADGRLVFDIPLPSERPDSISIIAPGVLAYVYDDELLIGGA